MIFLAHVEKGKLTFSDATQARLNDYLKEHEGMELEIKPREKIRKLSLNARYWAYLGECEDETGNLATDLHEIGKRKFLKPKFIKVDIDGKEEEIRIPSSTRDLTSGEFMEYLDKFVAWTGIRMRTREELGYLTN